MQGAFDIRVFVILSETQYMIASDVSRNVTYATISYNMKNIIYRKFMACVMLFH